MVNVFARPQMRRHMGCGVSIPARPDPYPMPTKPAPPPGERHAFRRRHVPSSSSSPHASLDSETSFQSCVSFISDELLETSQVPSPTPPATPPVGIGESASPRTPDRRPMTASRLPTRPAPPARVRFGARAQVRFMTTSEKTAGGWALVASASGGGVSAAFDSDRDRPSALRGVDLVALLDEVGDHLPGHLAGHVARVRRVRLLLRAGLLGLHGVRILPLHLPRIQLSYAAGWCSWLYSRLGS